MSKILVSVVCYANEDEVIAFGKQLSSMSNHDVSLAVTCNKTQRINYLNKNLNELPIKTYIFIPDNNIGYLPGCLFGARSFKERGCNFDWLMICNTDIEFCDSNFFNITNDVDQNVWALGPDIVLKTTGAHQNPFMEKRPSKFKFKTWHFVYSNYFLFSLYFSLNKMKSKIQSLNNSIACESKRVYGLHGSAFLIRDDCYYSLMNYNKLTFMYGEELLVSETCFSKNKIEKYDNRYVIIHNENQVTGNIPSRNKQQWFRDSIDLIIDVFNPGE